MAIEQLNCCFYLCKQKEDADSEIVNGVVAVIEFKDRNRNDDNTEPSKKRQRMTNPPSTISSTGTKTNHSKNVGQLVGSYLVTALYAQHNYPIIGILSSFTSYETSRIVYQSKAREKLIVATVGPVVIDQIFADIKKHGYCKTALNGDADKYPRQSQLSLNQACKFCCIHICLCWLCVCFWLFVFLFFFVVAVPLGVDEGTVSNPVKLNFT